jgi:hypothetical protein
MKKNIMSLHSKFIESETAIKIMSKIMIRIERIANE